MSYQSTLVGLVGEYLARDHLQPAGWAVKWEGGNTRDLDLIAHAAIRPEEHSGKDRAMIATAPANHC